MRGTNSSASSSSSALEARSLKKTKSGATLSAQTRTRLHGFRWVCREGREGREGREEERVVVRGRVGMLVRKDDVMHVKSGVFIRC